MLLLPLIGRMLHDSQHAFQPALVTFETVFRIFSGPNRSDVHAKFDTAER